MNDNFKSPDYFDVDKLFTEEQLLIRESVRDWVRENVSPIIEDAALEGVFPKHLVKSLGEIGGFGGFLPLKYGGSEIDFTSYGLMMQELERGDSSLRVLSSIQSGLVMKLIYQYADEKQKDKYLLSLSNGDNVGSFGMSEPNHGSDPSSMLTRFDDHGDYYLINGSKLWIGQAPICDLALFWARNQSDEFALFLVERGFEGFETSKIKNKWGFRGSETGELIFNNMKLQKENLLFKTKNIQEMLSCLNIGRYAVAWGALGIAMDCYDCALKYSTERIQFGKKIASYQLVQKKLSDMITEITKIQILVWRLGKLMNESQATFEQISLAKRSSVSMASEVAIIARSILGGMGVTAEYPVMRHILNLEVLKTYQGTEEIHTLITGKSITGISAFRS